MCKYAYEPWASSTEESRVNRRPTRPIVWSTKAQAMAQMIQCTCSDSRNRRTIDHINLENILARLPLEVMDSEPFHLVCDAKTEFAEAYRCGGGTDDASSSSARRTCGRCSPLSTKSTNENAGESSSRVVKAGTTECLTAEAKAMFDEVKLWLDSVGGITGAETHEKWEFATELSLYELGTTFHVSKSNVANLDVVTNSDHGHIYRACAHRAPGFSNVMLHVRLIHH